MLQTKQSALLCWLAAAQLPGVGPVTVHRWLSFFKKIEAVFSASQSEWTQAGVTEKQQAIIKATPWEKVQKDLDWCQAHDCHMLSWDDERYPALLREISDPPLVLLVRGDPALLTKPQIALVGSRNPSIMGREMAGLFAQSLAKAGLVITSGLAIGIDAVCHRGALSVQGKTLAVLGSGVNSIYPVSNRKLAEQIIAEGALVSEFMPDEMAKARNFPRRNRIISGLSLGVLVIEAALKSGSLITAKYAIEQNREVFAIPGSIRNPLARGCHQLIHQGAKLVEKAEDILEELGAFRAVTEEKNNSLPESNIGKLDVKSKRLLTKIDYEATPFDVIIQRSGLTASEVSSMLLTLELLGFVQKGRGGYSRCMGTMTSHHS